MLIEAKRIKQEETSKKKQATKQTGTNKKNNIDTNKRQNYLIGSNNSLLCGCSTYVHVAWR